MTAQKKGLGGGTGGGADSHNHIENISGGYRIQANQLELLSRPPIPPVTPDPCRILVLASDYGAAARWK